MGLKPHKPSDYPSFLLYTHLTVTVLTASFILYTRSAHSAYFAAGALLSSLTAKFIKGFIKSPRPPPPPPPSGGLDARTTHIRPKKTYGMPSTHSTALTFYFAYLVPVLLAPGVSLASRHLAVPPPHALSRPAWTAVSSLAQPITLSSFGRYLAAGAVTAYWVGGVWSRIELGYHTYGQCFGGVGLGMVLAAAWRAGWDSNPWFGVGLQGVIDRIWAVVFP